ncbi:MAG: hypothetical protein CVU03_02220 [Bacteroidetes bacterium HGW-Bacteroidetes-2]|jgi:hypothetical protein|nr:MAG: hypothetical protein CVU13_06095 [Bacteroidetes bacterium HGW-Bacteroidetes-8]PKP26711.1 MAG: hypothetical protein CVU03_02220 [Bacteroidetes bacterium HGW-Bacteroidetes-2]
MLEFLLKIIFARSVAKLWENKDLLDLYLKTLFGKYRNKEIRFSISYLFKIQIPGTDKYLLVLNRRIENQLQPVGGVYKRYGDDKLFNEWGYSPDNKHNGLDVDSESDGDLRFKVIGKNVVKVIKWFDEGKEREVSADREFNEELINTSIMNAHVFRQIKYKHIRRFSKHLKWSEFFSCYEVLVFDVFELLPNEEQKEALKTLSQNKNNLKNGYAIVSSDDIRQLRFMENGKQIARIGAQTKLLINQKF